MKNKTKINKNILIENKQLTDALKGIINYFNMTNLPNVKPINENKIILKY